MNKGIELNQIRKSLKWTKNVGIRTKGFFMIGNPLETKETIEVTIKFAKEIDLDDFQMSLFTPLSGSEVYKNIKKYGSFEDNWKKMNMWYPVFVPHGLTYDALLYYQRKAMRSFYLRSKIIFSYLLLCIKRLENIIKLFKGGILLLKNLGRKTF